MYRKLSKTIISNEKTHHKLWSLVPTSTTPCVRDIVVVAAGSVEVASIEVSSLLSVVVTASVDLSCSPHSYTQKTKSLIHNFYKYQTDQISLVSLSVVAVFHQKIILWSKVNSVQEACAKCFAVHLLKFEILQTTWKNKTKIIKMLKNRKQKVWSSDVLYFIYFM